MATEYKFSEEDLIELMSDNSTLPASLATLINEHGDIGAFLVKKLEERAEAADKFHLSQISDADDWNSLHDAVEANEARYINTHHFA